MIEMNASLNSNSSSSSGSSSSSISASTTGNATLTNGLLLIVLVRSKHFREDFYPLAVLLGVIDLCLSLTSLEAGIFRIYIALAVPNYTRALCLFATITFYTVSHCGHWTTFFLALDRLLAIALPVKYFFWDKQHIAIRIGVAIVVFELCFSTVYVIPQDYAVKPPQCGVLATFNEWQVVVHYIKTLGETGGSMVIYLCMLILLWHRRNNRSTNAYFDEKLNYQIKVGRKIVILLLFYCTFVGVPNYADVFVTMFSPQFKGLLGPVAVTGDLIYSILSFFVLVVSNWELRKELVKLFLRGTIPLIQVTPAVAAAPGSAATL